MKKVVLLSVDLQDLEGDSSFLPGAKEFQEKHRRFEEEYSYYRFDQEEDEWARAEKDLQAAGLRYEKGYRLELEDDEIASHPVHYLIIPALYDLVTGKKAHAAISAEAAGFAIAQDFKTEIVVAQEKMYDELRRLNQKIKAAPVRAFSVKKKKYRMLADLPQFEAPMLIAHGAVRENEGESRGTYYMEGWDGRSSLSHDAVDFVKSEHIVAARIFEFQGRKYRQNAPNYLISGQLASFLRKKFKTLQVMPMTLGLLDSLI